MAERPLIVIDLDNTFADYTTAFKDCLTQMGYDGYADAPDPSDYSFACEGWFGNVRTQPVLHRRAVGLGLYLRERPYPHAPEALDDLRYGGFRIVLATSRYDDQEDTDRWLCGMGFEGGRLDDLAECNTDFATIVRDRWTARLVPHVRQDCPWCGRDRRGQARHARPAHGQGHEGAGQTARLQPVSM